MHCFVEAEGGGTQRNSMELLWKYGKAVVFCQLSSDFISCDVYKRHPMPYASKFMTKISIKLSG